MSALLRLLLEVLDIHYRIISRFRQFKNCHQNLCAYYHLPTWADRYILEKNCSSGSADSVPGHLGVREIKDKSLWTVDVSMEIRFLSRCISALHSACKCAPAMIKLLLRAV